MDAMKKAPIRICNDSENVLAPILRNDTLVATRIVAERVRCHADEAIWKLSEEKVESATRIPGEWNLLKLSHHSAADRSAAAANAQTAAVELFLREYRYDNNKMLDLSIWENLFDFNVLHSSTESVLAPLQVPFQHPLCHLRDEFFQSVS